MNALNTNRINVNSPYKVCAEGLVPVSLSQEENMTVAGTAKLLLFTNEQGKTNNNCY